MSEHQHKHELEEAIAANPDDVEGYLAYGRWLQAAGDPRGELIALQARGAQEEAQALLQQHAETFYGPVLAQHAGTLLTTEWRHGFMHAARLAWSHEHDPQEKWVGMTLLVEALLRSPSARFLRSLTLGVTGFDAYYQGSIDALRELTPRCLETLHIGDFAHPDEMEMSWADLGDFAPLWSRLPRLRKLILQSGQRALGQIQAPALRHFELRTGGLDLESLRAVCAAQWPQLQHLDVWFGSEDYGAQGGLEDIQPLLRGDGLGQLQHLGLKNASFTDALCAALPGASVLPQLQSLDLSMGIMTDAGAQALAAHAPAFKHLQRLNVADNYLSPAGVACVQKLCAHVITEPQREDDDPDYRFVAVGE